MKQYVSAHYYIPHDVVPGEALRAKITVDHLLAFAIQAQRIGAKAATLEASSESGYAFIYAEPANREEDQ